MCRCVERGGGYKIQKVPKILGAKSTASIWRSLMRQERLQNLLPKESRIAHHSSKITPQANSMRCKSRYLVLSWLLQLVGGDNWHYEKLRASSIDLDTIWLHLSLFCQRAQLNSRLESGRQRQNQRRSGSFMINIKF